VSVITSPTTGSRVPRTKLHHPRVAADLVERQRLFARLDRGVSGKLTVVFAPAGYGKSTLLGAWLARRGRDAAWLSLDEHDDTLPTFARALITAIQTKAPAVGRTALAFLNLPDPPSPSALAVTLADELTTLADPLLIILDDYQRISSATAHELVSGLLIRLPDRVHIIVSSRTLPPLPLATLRAAGQLTEIRADDLKFSPAEARTFLDQAVGEHLPDHTVATLEERTEGWPAGLRLAAVLLRDRPDRRAILAAFDSGSHEYVREYLLAEVFSAQPSDVQQFMFETSILDRFCASLCSAVLGWSTARASQEMLGRLVRGGVMVVSLDERGEWFRYHHLVEAFLSRRLRDETTPDAVAILHRRAARWLAGKGQTVEAVRHLLAAGEIDSAAHLVEADVHAALNREDWSHIADGLAALPIDAVDSRPALLAARAWVLYFQGRAVEIAPVLERAEAALQSVPHREEAPGSLRGELDSLWSEVWICRGDARAALTSAQHALQHLAADQPYARGFAAGNVCVALHRMGRGREARRLIKEQTDRESGASAVCIARLLLRTGYCYLADGQLGLLENHAWKVLAFARTHHLPVSAAWAHYGLGRVLYEWNDLEGAAKQFAAVIEHRHEANHDAYRDSVLGLALTHQASGRPELAQAVIRPLLQLMQEAGRARQLAIIQSFKARLALMTGDDETWSAWLDRSGDIADTDAVELPQGLESARVTRAWALLAERQPTSLSEADVELAALEHQCASVNDRPRLIQVMALRALVCQARGGSAAAATALEAALAFGRRGPFVRTFVDLGPPMARMLSGLAAGGRARPYLRRLQAAFAVGRPSADSEDARRDPGFASQAEPLTWREQDVLKLLGRRLSNKEIADALDISPLTVKKHAENVYRKLHARGRREAVARARQAGLLDRERDDF
jgi:LuxR family transcriptional regulator, maltose regulon positive regulatory protein